MSDSSVVNHDEESNITCSVKFEPPVYIQRYIHVRDLLSNAEIQVKTLVDFGCSDLKFIKYIKALPDIREIAAVDIDYNTLDENRSKAAPLTADYIHRRKDPLSISLYQGSIGDYDARLRHYDAVTCIELIEHLQEEVLNKLPEIVFGLMRPKIVVFTTPNADFNILFPTLKGFRHWDHKFEWTREEFSHWCNEILKTYPFYSVTIDGVGKGPPEYSNLGCCSQLAVFTLLNDTYKEDPDITSSERTPYKLVETFEHPYRKVQVTTPTMILEEIEYYLRVLTLHSYWSDSPLQVPLQKLLEFPRLMELCGTIETLRETLRSAEYELIIKDGQWVLLYSPDDNSDEEESGFF